MASLFKTPRSSLSPLLITGAAYLTTTAIKNSWKNPNLNMDPSSQATSTLSGLLGLSGSSHLSTETSESRLLEVLGDYLSFMLLSALFHLIIILFARLKGFVSRHSKGKHCQLPSQDTNKATHNEFESFDIYSEHEPEINLIKLIKPLIKAALYYTLIFCFFEIALFCAFTSYTSGKISHNLPPLTPEFRVLEVAHDATPAVSQVPQTPEKVSFAMGRVLALFDVEATALAMSQDEKWTYVPTKNPQLIRIYDTSDFKAPAQVAAIDLGKLARSRVFVKLSADGKLLIATNYEDVKVFNVSDPKSPKLLGSYYSPMYKSADGSVSVPMALSQDNKYLFMAQVGFAILDISNPSNITLIYSSVERAPSGTGDQGFFRLSSDGKLLYMATGKGALDIYNVTNPYKPTRINQIVIPDTSATSVILTRSGKTAYIAGNVGKTLVVNTLDISNPLDVKITANFKVEAKIATSIIQALSPQETKLYIVQHEQGLVVVDLISMSEEVQFQTLVKAKSPLLALSFSPSGQYLSVVFSEQISFIQLFTNYPNTKIFTPSNTTVGSFLINKRFESWAMSQDGKVLFASFNDYERTNPSFEIWNITAGNRIASLGAGDLGVNLAAPFLTFKMSPDSKRAYLKWWTREASKLIILDISGDLMVPKKLKECTVPLSFNFEDFLFSKNESILATAPNSSAIVLYNLQSPEQNSVTLQYQSDLKSSNFDMEFAKNDTALLIITSKISIYNISDLSRPVFLGSVSMTEGGSPRILSTEVLEEEDVLIVEWYQTSRKLRVYNLSEISAPKLISELDLPKRTFKDHRDILQEFYGPFVYCESQKAGFVGANGNLVRVNLSDVSKPTISGIISVTTCANCGTSRFIISPDGNTALSTNQPGMLNTLNLNNQSPDLYKGSDLTSQIFAINLQIQSTLYISQEKFFLGRTFSDNVFVLENTGKDRYQVSPRAQSRILQLYSFEVSVLSSEEKPQIITSPLPDWIKFHQDTHLLTVEPKSKNNLGFYTICAAISHKVNEDDLNNIVPKNELSQEDELTTTLINFGYLNRQFYLTTEFGTRDEFFLPKKYADYRGKIYDILSSFYLEDCTKIEILPSLSMSILKDSNTIWIDTASYKSLKIDVTLLPDIHNEHAQFVSKAYGPLIPEIRDQKSRMILEGSLNEIHTALDNVVINAKDLTFYDGIISVTDGLNYPIERQRINNISNYFLKNVPPYENPKASRTFREQLDRVPVATGQYFAIMWDENTFIDDHADTLHYEVVIDNDGNTGKPKSFPDWLTFQNLALRGTPPEKLSDREVPLKFIVRNEFQNVTIPFKLKIAISPAFAMSLLLKYSPMLLTALGLYIKANKIYNIVAKKIYKHPKEYEVRVGEEIASQKVFPILFIESELKEAQIIMRQLGQYLRKSGFGLVFYFIDESTRALDRTKLTECINQALVDFPAKEKKKLSIYLDGSDFDRRKIIQIIFNEMALLQLNSPPEKLTKSAFNKIKGQWAELIQWDPELLFVIKQEKLSELLDSGSINIKEESTTLLAKVNHDLLQDAIISHAFKYQSLNARSTMVLIEIYERVIDSEGIKTFLKKDLEGFHLNSKAAVDYGVKCQLEDGMLIFSGTPKANFRGRTLAVQIQNIQWRILKEIWIQEKSTGGETTTIELSSRGEESLRGDAYESL